MLTQEDVGKDFTTQNRKFYNTHTTKQFVFYQAGRCLIQTLLFDHPKVSLFKVTESENLVSSIQSVPKQSFGPSLKPPFSAIETRINLETLLIGLYAGKASERFLHYRGEHIHYRGEHIHYRGEHLHDSGEHIDYTKIESDVSFCSLLCKEQPVVQRVTYKKKVVVSKTKRKHLVHVNGLFANGAKLRAKRDSEITVQLSQIRYTCGTLFELGVERLALQGNLGKKETSLIYPKQIIMSKPGYHNSAMMPYQTKVLVKCGSGCAKAEQKDNLFVQLLQRDLFRFQRANFFATTVYQKPSLSESGCINPVYATGKELCYTRASLGYAKTSFLQDNGVARRARYAKACNKNGSSAGSTFSSLISKASSVLNNKGITVDYCLGVYGQSRSLLPLQYYLLCNQHKSCLLSFGNFSLHNQLDDFKIESFLWQSDTGLLERIKAAFLLKYLLFKGSIYLPNLFNLQKNNIVGNLNKIEIQDKKSLDLLKDLEEQTTNIYLGTDKQNQSLHSNNFSLTHSYKKGLITKGRSVTEVLNTQALQYEIFVNQLNQSSQANTFLFSKKIDSLSQKKERSVWCEENVCKPLTSSIRRYGHWFRIYLPQIETDQQLAKPSFLHSVCLDQFFKKRRELGFSEYTKVSSLNAYCVKDLGTLTLPNIVKIASFSAPPFYAPSKISFLSVLPITPTKFLDQVNCYYSFIWRPTKTSFSYKKQAVAKTKFDLPEQALVQSFGIAPKIRSWSGLQKAQVSSESKSVAQLEVSPYLNTFPQTFKYVWPQELGYGLCHKLVLNVFSRALNLLNKNRELLDILADHLIRFGKIRAPEISRICSFYVETDHKSFRDFN